MSLRDFVAPLRHPCPPACRRALARKGSSMSLRDFVASLRHPCPPAAGQGQSARKKQLEQVRLLFLHFGGETGIRTLGTVARSPHFECGPIDHSGISPICLKYKKSLLISRFQGFSWVPSRIRTDDIQNHNLTL